MTSVEIEDVLSSIRRLVTEDLRPKPVAVPAAVDGKLILTPALRVVPDLPEPDPAPQAGVLDVDLDADLAAALTDDAAVVDPEATLDADAGPFPMFLHHANRVDLGAASSSTDFAETVTTIGAGLPAEGYEAELGDVMAVPEWPDTSWAAPDVIEGVEEAELIAVPESSFDTPIDVRHADWAADAQDQPYPADPDLQGSAADDAAEAAALAALAADDAAQDAGGLTELDEDMLRDIVREIIREELHGALGERITRNVRKLVRAEINRALITQDLE